MSVKRTDPLHDGQRGYQTFAMGSGPSAPIDADTPRIDNNSNLNVLSGIGSILNQNSSLNLHSSPGAVIHYAPVTSVSTPGPKELAEIQAKIAAALKERHVPGATYDAQPGMGCMDGTRVQVLRDIESWIMSSEAQQIFWLVGMAGTGKTTIAETVCSLIHDHARVVLGGSFFCSRSAGSTAQRNVRCVVPTLAQLLARQSTEFSKALADQLDQDPDILHKQIKAQIKHLLYTPLLAIKNYNTPIIFVIDALDECGDQVTDNGASDDAESHRIVSEMLEALVDLSRLDSKLPFKVLVTSRPETHIRDTPISDATFSAVLRLHNVNKNQVTEDIRLYISIKLSTSQKLRTLLTRDDQDMLVRVCDGLFIVAATALKYLLGAGIDVAAKRFRRLLNSAQDGLSSGAAAPLDRMYGVILEEAARIDETDTDELQTIMQLLASLISAQTALSVAALAGLLVMDKDDVRATLSRLHAVVHVPDSDIDPRLYTLHASFGDYLMCRAPERLRIPQSLGNDTLARGCLLVMADQLHFNISQSSSSHKENLLTRPNITLALEYACLQWIYHSAGLSDFSTRDQDIGNIFCERLLFWLEVMSVLNKVRRAAAMLVFAAATVRLPELARFFRDANAFVASSREAIERSAPHIYVSALPFAFKESLIYQKFSSLCSGLLAVQTLGIDRHGGRLVMTLSGRLGPVYSVAYSLDGRLIGSGSNGGEVRIWDIRTGEETMAPIRFGNSAVLSVAFAPDGGSCAAGTEEGVVYIRSLLKNGTNLPRLCGHGKQVLAVTFSPDGTLLASASADKTVCLWQGNTGLLVKVLKGHLDEINAISFSPDSATLVSVSKDRAVLLWNVTTGEPAYRLDDISFPQILSIRFTQGLTRLFEGRARVTIEVRSLVTNTVAGAPHHPYQLETFQSLSAPSLVPQTAHYSLQSENPYLKESPVTLGSHARHIVCACSSPDGLYAASAASASGEDAIRIWDTNSSQQVIEPVSVHEGGVLSATISQDGGFIVSGSEDCSVRSWDIQTGEPRFDPLVGHSDAVYSVTVSQTGQLVASASADKTVRIWRRSDQEDDGLVLWGHEGEVNAVAFSHDALWVASGSDDCTVRLWHAATSQQARFSPLLCSYVVRTVAFSPDGRLLAAGDVAGQIHLWRAETGRLVCEPLKSSNYPIHCIGFSPESTRIVYGGEDNEGHVWDVNVREKVLDFRGHTGWVLSVAFSSTGRLVCSGSGDQTVRLWDATTGTTIATLRGHTHWVRSVAFTRNEQSIVSCSEDKTIRVWDVHAARLSSSENVEDPVVALGTATLKEGWLVGPSNELLLWIPTEYRSFLHWNPCTLRIDRSRVGVTIGPTGWHHGTSWTSCWRGASPLQVIRTTWP